MNRHVHLLFVASLVICSSAKGQNPPKPQSANSRFSPEAVELLAQMTQSYDLGTRIPAGGFDVASMARLAKSKSEPVRDLARDGAMLKWLKEAYQDQNKEIRKAFEDQIAQWPKLFIEQMVASLGADEKETPQLKNVVGILEDMMGQRPQAAVNTAWMTACAGNGLANDMKAKIRLMANASGPSGKPPRDAIEVRLMTDIRRLGGISIANRTDRPLRNCVIFTRLEADKDLVRVTEAQEKKVGTFVLPALGFSETTVRGSLKASHLRTVFHLQDKGVMIYVPEIPPGGMVTTLLARPDYLLIGKRASVSVWCDDWAIEDQESNNWAAARAAIELAMKPPRAAETEAATALTKLGAKIERDATFPSRQVMSVIFTPKAVGDGLHGLKEFRQLQTLMLSGPNVTTAALSELKGLGELRSLVLSKCAAITDESLKEINGLKRLAVLWLDGTSVTDAGLDEVASHEELDTLKLDGTGVTDAGLAKLKRLQYLRGLGLERTNVSGAGLKEVRDSRHLKFLHLNDTKLTDDGVREIGGLKSLEYVHLSNTSVTDAGLRELKGLKQLKLLNVKKTQVTDAGVQELKSALPTCQVVR